LNAGEKLVTIDELAEWRSGLRHAGITLALANGIFDILHVGHLRYLEGASRLADRLVVAVNSDRTACAQKGPGRPIMPEKERAELIAGIYCVDRVCIVDDMDMRSLIRRIEPDVHVKGTDYTPDTVPEADEVRKHGGIVEVAGDQKKHSASGIIEKIRNNK